MNIGQLTIEMAANVARLQQDMQRATSVVESATAKMQAAANLATKALGAIGVGLSVAGLAAWIKGAIDAADETGKLAQSAGITTKQVAGLQVAFAQNGTADAFGSSMSKLSKNVVDGSKALEAMGIKTREANGQVRSTRDILGDVAGKFATYSDGAAKTALSMELFGKTGADLIPLLNQGSDALDGYDQMAAKLGLTLDESTTAAAGQFNDTIDLLGRGTRGVANGIAAQLLPTLSGLAGQFLENMTAGDKMKDTANFLATGLKLLYIAGLGVVEVFRTLGKTGGAAFAAIAAGMRGDFSEAKAILADLSNDVGTSWKNSLAEMDKAWNTTGNAAVVALAKTNNAANKNAPELEKIKKAADAAAKALAAQLDAQIETLRAADKVQIEAVKQTVATLTSLRQREAIDEVDAINRIADAQIQSMETSRAALAAEMLVVAQKQNNQKELATLAGKVLQINEQIDNREKQRTLELEENEDRLRVARIKSYDVLAQGTEALRKELETLEFEGRKIGLNAEAVRDLERARAEEMATALERKALRYRDDLAMQQEYEQLMRQAQLIRDIAGRKGKNAIAEEAAADWKRFSDSLYNGLTDSLFRAFEQGGSFFKTFWNGVKNTFKTTILKFTIEGVSKGVFSFLGLDSLIGGGGGLGGAISTASSLNSAYGAVSQFFNGGAAGASTASLAGANAVETLGGDGIGALIKLNGNWAGVGAEGAAAGSGAGGFGSSIATSAGPLMSAAATAVALSKFFEKDTPTYQGHYGVAYDGKLLNDRTGETYTSQGQEQWRNGGRQVGIGNGNAYESGTAYSITDMISGKYDADKDNLMKGAVQGTAAALQKVLTDIGSTSVLAGFNAGSVSYLGAYAGGMFEDGTTFGKTGAYDSPQATWRKYAGEEGGMDGYFGALNDRWRSPGSQTAEGGVESLANELMRATVEALQVAANVPKTISNIIKDVDVSKMTDDEVKALLTLIDAQVTAVNGFRTAMEAMPFENFKKLSFSAASGLIEMNGGLEALLPKLDSYYQHFYSDAERQEHALKAVQKAMEGLGYSGIDSMAKFRELFESLDPETEEGQKLIAQLLEIESSFAAVYGKAKDAADGTDELASALDRANKEHELSVRWLRLLGKESEAVALERAKELEEMKRFGQAAVDLLQKIYQLEDAMNATDAAYEALERAVAKEREALTTQITLAQQTRASLESIFRALANGAQSLYQQSENVAAANFDRARQFIAQSAATADTSGYLPDQADLTNALSAISGGFGAAKYATTFEAETARLETAGDLKRMSSIAGNQLTSADKQLLELQTQVKQLDDILAKEKDSINALRGIDGSVASVAAAVTKLHEAIELENELRRDELLQTKPYQVPDEGGSAREVFGPTSLPSFDVGTDYVPRDMIAQIHEGERIVPKRFNLRESDIGGGSAAIVDELRRTRDDMRNYTVQINQKISDIARVVQRWDGGGLPERRDTQLSNRQTSEV